VGALSLGALDSRDCGGVIAETNGKMRVHLRLARTRHFPWKSDFMHVLAIPVLQARVTRLLACLSVHHTTHKMTITLQITGMTPLSYAASSTRKSKQHTPPTYLQHAKTKTQ